SVGSNLKLYRESTADVPGEVCVFNGSWWCEVALGRMSFMDDQVIQDTSVVAYPRNFMASSTTHRAMIYGGAGGALSSYGMPLAGASMNYDIDGGGVDGYSWTFDTGSDACDISHTLIDPAWDIFFCSTSNCYGDSNPGSAGNQHEYTAFTYDIRGNLLTVDEHQWSIINGLLNNVPAGTVVNSQIEATATNQNGTETLLVEVSDSHPEVAGTANAQARVDLVMCEGPWPGYASFPWEPTTNLYNYSTFYCQDSGIEGEETLPFINPATSPTTPNPDGVLPNGEHIFLVQPPTSALSSDLANAGFGALAYNSDKTEDDIVLGDKWYQKFAKNILGIKKAEGQSEIIVGCTPSPGVNLHIVAANETHVYLDWQRPATAPIPTNYLVRRRIVGESVWATVAGSIVATEYDDTSVEPNVDYEYSIWSWYNGLGNPICTEPGGYMSPTGSNSVQIRTTSEQPTFDLIGIRVMGNEDHLSISDWYNKYAPNPEIAGALIEVDGYEALQVGSTTYVAGSNISPGTAIWTNVYIISHNEGASMPTREIYSQMIANMKLNINVDQQNNTCASDPAIACSSDFDCSTGACNSRGLKLRRDTKRLADLVHIKNAVENYGQSHKSCSTAPGRSCVTDADCASVSGFCIPFYPMLESGSFVNGLTTSNWPESWGTNFPNLLNVPVNSLPRDPIGLFNGCPDDTMPGGPTDPNTCWNEIDQVFTCPLDSLTYLFNDLGSTGSDYTIGANFEYDMNPFGATFAADLAPVGVSAIPHLNASLDTWCNATTYSPGPVTNPLCGNGIPDAGEECDGGFRNLCDETLFPANWWNERLGGCNLPGTLGECLWYDPSPALTAAQCGGYCGNANIDAPYENCDAAAFDGLYTCYNPSSRTFENPTCDGSICQPLCPSTGLLAAACGDGYWDPDKEQCDESALPDGLAGWDCSDEGSASCNLCRIECTTGVVYGGECGDGTIDSPYEECEPISWVTPPAEQSSSTNEYLCHGEYCTTYGGFCGDGYTYIPGLDFYQPEQCDYLSYVAPDPIDSSSDRQYICSDGTDIDPATATIIPSCTIGGGWCGDGFTFDSSGASQLQLNMNFGLPESCDDFDDEDTNVCTNGCQWSCHIREVGGVIDDDPIEGMLIAPAVLDQSEGLLFDNSYPTIDLYSGDSTTVNLRSCRVSGPLAVDVTIENNDSYAGIVFIIDRSGSMVTNDIPGYSSRMAATRDAIAGSGNALDSILARNPSAQVALVSFGSDAYVNSGFVNIAEEIDTLKAIVNSMDASLGMTDHEAALARTRALLEAENFENNIVIFMTDGECTEPSGVCEAPALTQAELIKFDPPTNVYGEIFTVALSPNNASWAPIRGYMNAISSSDCSYTNYGLNSVGECGGVSHQGTNCYSYDSNDPTVTRPVWEQCDPAVDADCYGPGAIDADGEYVECRWTPASTETNYFYAGQDVTSMYANISGSIPVNTVELGLTFLETGGDGPPTSVITNGTYYIDTRGGGVDCDDPHNPIDNIFSLGANFTGNPNAYLRLSNPRYMFCPWDNCVWCD
ncbi:VWA domain-containing protein, partial [Candidatus Parcubacteria bacterium]